MNFFFIIHDLTSFGNAFNVSRADLIEVANTSTSVCVYSFHIFCKYLSAAIVGSVHSFMYCFHNFPNGSNTSVPNHNKVSTYIIFLLYASGCPDCIAHAITGFITK